MVKEIVVWCNPCVAVGEREAGSPHTLGLDDTTVETDLCEMHLKQFATLMEALVGTVVTVDGDRQETRKKCPFPGCSHEVVTGKPNEGAVRSALRAHFESSKVGHGLSLATWERQQGRTVNGEPILYGCTTCPEGYTKLQRLGVHVARKHNREVTEDERLPLT